MFEVESAKATTVAAEGILSAEDAKRFKNLTAKRLAPISSVVAETELTVRSPREASVADSAISTLASVVRLP